jgi:hypothetical protein
MTEPQFYWTECGWSFAYSAEPTYVVRTIMGSGTITQGYSSRRDDLKEAEATKQLG